MRKHMGMIVLAGIVVVLLLVVMVSFTTATEEMVMVQTLGRTTRTFEGETKAGLRMKWPLPFERIVRYDARLRVFESTHQELQTKDGHNFLVTTFCTWLIKDPQQFYRATEQGRVETVEQRLRDLLRKRQQDVIAQHNMDELVNTDPERMHLEQIEQEIYGPIAEQAMRDYGVDVAMVGIKSLALPERVSTTVIDSMKEERSRVIKEYRAAGAAEAEAIRQRARQAAQQITAFAKRKAETIRAEGDRKRSEFFEALETNRELAIFLRRLEVLQAGLKDNAVIVFDGSMLKQFEWFRKGPGQALMEEQTPAPAEEAPAGTPTDER